MNLQGYRDTFYTYSGKVSDICRPLALAGIGILWIFKKDTGGQITVPHELILPGLLIIGGLLADLLQYFVGSIIWLTYYRVKESEGVGEEVELPLHSVWLEVPIQILFWAKAILFVVAYYFIAIFFYHAVTFQ
jgi:hypothetical protein